MKTWIDRLPRPDRSGVIGAVMMVNLWITIVTPVGGGIPGICEIMPWKCRQREDDRQRRQYQTTKLAFYGHGKSKPICACHYDVRLAGEHGLIHHIASGPEPYACGSPSPIDDEGFTSIGGWYRPKHYDSHDGFAAATPYLIFNFPVGPSTWKFCPKNQICFADSNNKEIRLMESDEFRNHCTDNSEYIREYGEVINSEE